MLKKEGDIILIAMVRERNIAGYVLPKGHVNVGESIREAAKREVSEETGRSDIRNIGYLGKRARMEFGNYSWKQTYYYAFMEISDRQQRREKNEIVTWFDIDKLPVLFWPEQNELVLSNMEKINELVERMGG